MDGVTLQISVAPGDLPHAREILPHQLRQWAGQVDEVLFVLDLGQSGERHREIEELLAELCRGQSHASTTVVDYSPAAVLDVRDRFFQGRPVPFAIAMARSSMPTSTGCSRRPTAWCFISTQT